MNFKAKLLEYYQIDEQQYADLIQDINELDYGTYSEFYDIKAATELINECIAKNEKIMIYGDYDADGIMSTSILVNAFNRLGVNPGYYIPSRSIDGYGITLSRAKQIKEKGYSLLITVDNGVKQFEALNYLKENGVKIILTDHHSFDTNLPSYDCFIHPYRKDIKEDNCGAYVAFMLAWSLLKEVDYYLLSLATLATISDMMPLNILHNRNIVRVGLAYIKTHKEHPFYKLTNKEINEEVLAFEIAPKINAYGRIKEDVSINNIVKLFINYPIKEKYRLIDEVESLNRYRKDLLKNSFSDAEIYEDEGIIAINEKLIDGLVGLLAARLLNTYNKPSVAFNLKDGVLKGSARSLKNCPLDVFFHENQDILLVSGGHSLAGGLSLKQENFELFKTRFNEFIIKHPFEREKERYIELDVEDINVKNYLILQSFSPFGTNFEEPSFLIKIKKENLYYLYDHIKANLNEEATLIGFNLKSQVISDEVNLIGKMKVDTYNKGKISFVASKIKQDILTEI